MKTPVAAMSETLPFELQVNKQRNQEILKHFCLLQNILKLCIKRILKYN